MYVLLACCVALCAVCSMHISHSSMLCSHSIFFNMCNMSIYLTIIRWYEEICEKNFFFDRNEWMFNILEHLFSHIHKFFFWYFHQKVKKDNIFGQKRSYCWEQKKITTQWTLPLFKFISRNSILLWKKILHLSRIFLFYSSSPYLSVDDCSTIFFVLCLHTQHKLWVRICNIFVWTCQSNYANPMKRRRKNVFVCGWC